MVSKQKILIVDDDNNIAELIALYLTKECFETKIVNDGEEALREFASFRPDLIILDLMLPGIDGYQVCREIRHTSDVPIIMLSAKGETFDKVLGLELGADDYMTKPFEFSELLARLRVMLRTVHISNDSILNYGSLQIDTNNHRVVRDGVTVDLTVREYAILEYLVRNKNIVVTREQIRANIWSIDDDINSNVVDVYIRYLRRKIDDPFEEKLIHTIRGVGYRLEC